MIAVEEYLNLRDYPLHQPRSRGYREMMRRIRAGIAAKGCAVLKGFVPPSRLPALVAEADRVAPFAHRSFNRTNVYFTRDDPSLPPAHPIRRFYPRSNAFVPADNFGEDSILRAIYEWAPLMPFLRRALGERRFYRYADPLADVIINVVEAGGGFPWHFDTNNYTVTLAIQNAESGGEFEYAPALRTPTEENYQNVQDILDGGRGGVETLQLEAGDLQLFKGRYTMHRVTDVVGARKRYVAIWSYAERPDMVASVERCKQLYGRVLPVHYARAKRRDDALID